jgi:hypothetical protein
MEEGRRRVGVMGRRRRRGRNSVVFVLCLRSVFEEWWEGGGDRDYYNVFD